MSYYFELPVNPMLHYEIEEAEGCDEGADDAVGAGHGEDEEHPPVVVAEHELVKVGATNAGNFGHAARKAQTQCVHEQLRETQELL